MMVSSPLAFSLAYSQPYPHPYPYAKTARSSMVIRV